MTKIVAIAVVAAFLGACSSMNSTSSSAMGNKAETKNSTEANKSGNEAAKSPAGATK
jgi:hypothetical protein